MAVRAHPPVWRVDDRRPERLDHESDDAAVLDVDQSVCAQHSGVPQHVRRQELRRGEKWPLVADDAKTTRYRRAGNLQPGAVVIGRALHRHESASLPDLLRLMLEIERSKDEYLDRDIDAGLDQEPLGV